MYGFHGRYWRFDLYSEEILRRAINRALASGQVTLSNPIAAGTDGASDSEFMLYLPLYNGVKSVEIGVPRDASFAAAAPRPAERSKPIVFYGTSITQGGCASRPGMVHTAIVGRRFDRPVINLGFSGNGRMEPELAELIADRFGSAGAVLASRAGA